MLKKNVRTCATFDAYLDVAKCSNNLVIFKYQIKKKNSKLPTRPSVMRANITVIL